MTNKIGMRIPPKLGEKGIAEVVNFAKQAGLDVLDVPMYNAEIKQLLTEAGLEVGSIDGVGSVGQTKLLSENERERTEAIENLKSQFTEIAKLGGKTIFMCLVPEDISQTRKRSFEIWKESFPEVVKHAENVGVYIALEGWPGPAPSYPTIGCTPEMLRAMFAEIPSKHFGVNYDPSHLVRLGIDYIRFLHEFGDRVNYCHGKDTEILEDELYESGNIAATFDVKYGFSEGSWRYTIPGHGSVRWDKVAVRLDTIGYTGPIGIELEDQRFWGSVEAESKGIIKAKEHLALYFK